jgi:hypothetical protein
MISQTKKSAVVVGSLVGLPLEPTAEPRSIGGLVVRLEGGEWELVGVVAIAGDGRLGAFSRSQSVHFSFGACLGKLCVVVAMLVH